MTAEERLSRLVRDLYQLYWSLNHGDDEHLAEIMSKNGYTLKMSGFAPSISSDETDEEFDD